MSNLRRFIFASLTILTALAAAACGASSPTATPAPLPTMTPTPANTPTSTPIPSPTATPTPIRTSGETSATTTPTPTVSPPPTRSSKGTSTTTPTPTSTPIPSPTATPTPIRTSVEASTTTPTSTLTRAPSLTATPCYPPTVVLDYVPPYGSYANLRGHVICVIPSDYKVAVYIKVSGWWTKPNFDSPLTAIQSNGTWTTDFTSGGFDQFATDLAAFLVPKDYNPPIMSGGTTLPQTLYTNAVAYASITRRATRTITFAGHIWEVKNTPIFAGLSPKDLSGDPEDVWVDRDGSLHLNIVNRGGIWYSPEVICADTLQYGAYTIRLGSQVDLLDKNVVLGFFSWDTDAPQYNYREIDIEFSRWGEDTAQNAQYVIQPSDAIGNRHRFIMNLTGTDSVHRFDWNADHIQFYSWEGKSLLQSWTYTNTSHIPPAGAGNARIKLWLLNGWAPSNRKDVKNIEVIIKSFQFIPAIP